MNGLSLSELSLLHLVSTRRVTSEALQVFVRARGLMSRKLIEDRHGVVCVTPMGREALHAHSACAGALPGLTAFEIGPRRRFRDLRG